MTSSSQSDASRTLTKMSQRSTQRSNQDPFFCERWSTDTNQQDCPPTMAAGEEVTGFDMEASFRYLTERASDVYQDVTFLTDHIYNRPAPPEWVSFLIGGIFSVISYVYWVIRVLKLKKSVGGAFTANARTRAWIANTRTRAWISAFIDNDAPVYTIAKMYAQSFLFLGGLQYNYELTFTVMLCFFALESTLDSLRVLLAFWEYNSLSDVVLTSPNLKSNVKGNKEKSQHAEMVQLKPRNVYEDLSRDKLIIIMVFITQAVLIAFVVTDIFRSETHRCMDGTPDCPVVGTLGSWGFYVLGIFMACVFLLGPKTNFGQSEQDPAFWLQLLLVAKQRAKCTWFDPTVDETESRVLRPSDWRIWMRFFMSFLINGVGFHILVHALPIQVASQSTLTGVVFRAVGMMYLVDLDDTPGYTLTIVQQEEDIKVEEQPAAKMDVGETAAQADQIIANARAQLDALAAGVDNPTKPKMTAAGGLLLAGAVTAGGAVAISQNQNKMTAEGDEEMGANGNGFTDDDAGGEDGGEDGGDDGGDNGGDQ